MNLGNLLKTRRKELGLTQTELAKRMGVSFQVISKWERNATFDNMQLSTFLKLLHVLKLNVNDEYFKIRSVTAVISTTLYEPFLHDDIFDNYFYEFLKEDVASRKIYEKLDEYQNIYKYTHISTSEWFERNYKYEMDEISLHDMLIRMFKACPYIKDKVCERLKHKTINSIDLMLYASDKSAQSEYLVDMIKDNCTILFDDDSHDTSMISIHNNKDIGKKELYELACQAPDISFRAVNNDGTNTIYYIDDNQELKTIAIDKKISNSDSTKTNQKDIWKNADLLRGVGGTPYTLEGSGDSIKPEMIKLFSSLNEKGLSKAIEQIELLAKIPEYQAEPVKGGSSDSGSKDNK